MELNKLQGHIPQGVLEQVHQVISKFSINNPLRLSHFLSQCAHESGNFTVVKENLNYSSDGLLRVFPKYFTIDTAVSHAKNPEKIANVIYGGRMGNINQGDGYKFSGRGYIQLTGRNNYTLFDDFVEDNIVETPSLVATKYPLLSAAWFWSTNGLNSIADTGNTTEVVTKITKRINGGNIGLADRQKHFNHYYEILK